MDEELKNELEYNHGQGYRKIIRDAKKTKEEKIKKEAENETAEKVGKIKKVGKFIKKYRFLIILVSIPTVFLVLISAIVGFLIFYCVLNPVECGWEATQETVKAIVE
ncbi:hypothetical protein KAS41_00115 [Candidatus Parcubacteria bacterium]|nr:hypothetical protein [Candidatus Parcubacteria bacterium]